VKRKPDLTSRLEQAGLVSSLGYGAGFPVLLPWGQQAVARLVQLFGDCLTDAVLGEWCEWEPELLVDEATYDAQMGGAGDFDNVYRLEYRGRRWVLRPDAAVDGLCRAMAAAGPSGAGSAFCVYTAHRNLHGSCTPMWRDRAIWPVMQLDIVSPGDRADAVGDSVRAGLDRFFEALGLPILRVDMGSWKGYARRRLDWVLATERAAPTVLAMAYTVGDAFRAVVGVPEDYEAFDVGLTAKPLATLVRLVEDGDRFVLPPAIAPAHVVVAGAGRDVLPASTTLRVAHVDGRARNWRRLWAERGVPVLLDFDAGGRAEQLVGNRDWEPWNPASSLDDLVDEACRSTPVGTPPWSNEGPSRFAALCGTCAAVHVLHAAVVPPAGAPCEQCGREGSLRLVADVDQIY